MKRILILTALLFFPIGVFVSCSSKNSPSSPGSGSGTPTITITITATVVSPTVTKTPVCLPYFSFGKNSLGSGNLAPSGGIMVANKFNLSVAGNLFRLNVYVASVPTPGTIIQMAVYTDNAGAPQSLVAQSTQQAAQTGWNSLDIPQTVLASGNYWLAVTSPSSSGGLNLSNTSGSTGDVYYTNASPGSLPANFGSGSSADWNFSMFADYCAIAGSPTPVNTVTFTPTTTSTVTLTITPTDTPACSNGFSFGRNYIGGHTEEIDNGTAASQFSLTAGGVVSTLHVYVVGNTGTSVKMGLYSDSASAPGTLITASASQVVSAGWNNFTVPGSFIPAGTYWIAAGSVVGSNGPQFAADTALDGSDPNDGYISGFSLIPSTYSGTGPNQFSLSVYADYCVPGSSPTPVKSPTKTFTPTTTSTPTATRTQTPGCSTLYSFGRNYIGGHTQEVDEGILASRYTLPVGGLVSALHIYVTTTSGASAALGLYSNSGSAPGTLITSAGSQVLTTGWNNFSVPGAVLPAGTYWIAAESYNISSGPQFAADTSLDGSDPTDGYLVGGSSLPSNFGGSSAFQFSLSAYADYCVPGSSPTPILSPTRTFTVTNTMTPTVTITETPVCSSPTTVGHTTSALNNDGTFSAGNVLASRLVLSSSGKIIRLRANIKSVATAGTLVQMGLYTDSGGAPHTLVVQSNTQPVTAGQNTFDIPDTGTLSAPATYWIAYTFNHDLDVYYDTNDATDGYYTGGGFGSMPATLFGSGPVGWTFALSADKCP